MNNKTDKIIEGLVLGLIIFWLLCILGVINWAGGF